MACTYPGRSYQLGITVCDIPVARYSSSPKICSNKRSDDPEVLMENWG